MTPPIPDPVPAGKIAPPSAPPEGSREPPAVTFRCPHCTWELTYKVTDEAGLVKIDNHLTGHPPMAPGVPLR